MSNQREAVVSRLNGSTELRLRKQLDRTVQNCFGAEQGLCVLVQLATSQMLAAGASRRSIEQALKRVVLEHPGLGPSRPAIVNGASRAAALTSLMLQWSESTDAVAREA